MNELTTLRLPAAVTARAPDGSDVRVLLRRPGGSMAHFELAEGLVARAGRHRTVDEIWFVLAGRGEMWRRSGDAETVVVLEPGVCLTIPVGARFQFRSSGPGPLQVVAVTMPPWPDAAEWDEVPGNPAWPASRLSEP